MQQNFGFEEVGLGVVLIKLIPLRMKISYIIFQVSPKTVYVYTIIPVIAEHQLSLIPGVPAMYSNYIWMGSPESSCSGLLHSQYIKPRTLAVMLT